MTIADDSKFCRKVNNDGDNRYFKNYLDKLAKWSEKMTDIIKFWEM